VISRDVPWLWQCIANEFRELTVVQGDVITIQVPKADVATAWRCGLASLCGSSVPLQQRDSNYLVQL
jgi:hypothetical protein